MVIDTSALLAILQDEPERRLFNEAIEVAESRVIAAASFVETSIVIESQGMTYLADTDWDPALAPLQSAACTLDT